MLKELLTELKKSEYNEKREKQQEDRDVIPVSHELAGPVVPTEGKGRGWWGCCKRVRARAQQYRLRLCRNSQQDFSQGVLPIDLTNHSVMPKHLRSQSPKAS